ncbi:ATPase (AAA+ superfamily) [Candidatus Magnetomorum sp. HK-1]|nr:ATPase (AAA+ superfamily) [Candidatus Magnetomorum sp. HK-1]
MNKILGREQEKSKLLKVLNSKQAEFLAIYGRRRIGKTFLIRHFFNKKGLYFELMGQHDTSYKIQLENFYIAILKTFQPDIPIKKPESWKEALSILTIFIKKHIFDQKIILFFDELPWLATKRSGLLQALDYEWNTEWNQIDNLKLIVCGSASSWIIDNLINDKGGLHNRITGTIHLKPLTMKESAAYLKSKGVILKPIQLLELYMVMGGVPFYLNQVEKGKSSIQIINNLCFQEEGLLFNEFHRLFRSLFYHSDAHYKIIREIARKGNNISRKALIESTGYKSGGGLKKILNELKSSGFIKEFVPFNKKERDYVIKIVDEYTLFFLQWIEPLQSISPIIHPNYWLNASKEPKYRTWSGFAFEAVCMKHINQIIKSLKIENLAAGIGRWQFIPSKGSKNNGAQIDLVIDRFDKSINICEIKFANEKYVISKSDAKNLVNKINVFESKTKTKKQIFLTMITTMGIKKNIWSEDLVDSEVILKDLL